MSIGSIGGCAVPAPSYPVLVASRHEQATAEAGAGPRSSKEATTAVTMMHRIGSVRQAALLFGRSLHLCGSSTAQSPISFCLAALFVVVLAAAALATEARAGTMLVTDPWTRPTTRNDTEAVVSVRVRNAGVADDSLVGAEAPVAGQATLAQAGSGADPARMNPVDTISIPAGQETVLKPDGVHIRLSDLKAPLAEHMIFPLTLRFRQSEPVTIWVPVVEPDWMPAEE